MEKDVKAKGLKRKNADDWKVESVYSLLLMAHPCTWAFSEREPYNDPSIFPDIDCCVEQIGSQCTEVQLGHWSAVLNGLKCLSNYFFMALWVLVECGPYTSFSNYPIRRNLSVSTLNACTNCKHLWQFIARRILIGFFAAVQMNILFLDR